MVQQYNQRLEEARLELVRNVRESLRQLMKKGYTGIIYGGTVGVDNELSNGRLLERSSHTVRRHILSRAPMWDTEYERKEITPENVPFEKYPVKVLLRIANDIEKILKEPVISPA